MKKLLIILLCLPLLFTTCKKEEEEPVYGCMIQAADNYNPSAAIDDGSCTGVCIGCTYQGGIIFYLDGNGGGLIAAPSDQGKAEWGCQYGVDLEVTGADGFVIGTGAQNTIDIVNANCSPNQSGMPIAANMCDTLTLGGYSDWFLPSAGELYELYYVIGYGAVLNNLPNISSSSWNNYWSSTEVNNLSAYLFYFSRIESVEVESIKYKSHFNSVRAVRAF
tara:strand:- start:224 stop:883 length:660 start_codon:yes stop_codon:yes gene_type:complete